MSKPSWDELPEWVNWIWIGSSGAWVAGYIKPRWDILIGCYVARDNSRWDVFGDTGLPEWSRSIRKNSLERRP